MEMDAQFFDAIFFLGHSIGFPIGFICLNGITLPKAMQINWHQNVCVCAFFGNKRLKLWAWGIDKRKRHWIIRLMILNISLPFHFIHFCIESLNTFLLLSLAFCAVAIVDFHIIYSQNVTTHIFFLLCHNVYVFLLERKSFFFVYIGFCLCIRSHVSRASSISFLHSPSIQWVFYEVYRKKNEITQEEDEEKRLTNWSLNSREKE